MKDGRGWQKKLVLLYSVLVVYTVNVRKFQWSVCLQYQKVEVFLQRSLVVYFLSEFARLPKWNRSLETMEERLCNDLECCQINALSLHLSFVSWELRSEASECFPGIMGRWKNIQMCLWLPKCVTICVRAKRVCQTADLCVNVSFSIWNKSSLKKDCFQRWNRAVYYILDQN